MESTLSFESILKRDRVVVIVGLVAVAALAWAYTGWLAWDMRSVDGGMASMGERSMRMPMTADWTVADFGFMFAMWGVMMVAMMTPSAAPMILIFGMVARKRRLESRPYTRTSVFVAGYLLTWMGFALAATFAEWGLHAATLVSPMGESKSGILGGALLITAGAFQWSPLKETCLTECRSPLSFLMADWREGAQGALAMGIRHGLYCLGCCWVLMLLLFVLGVMNLVWIAALAGVVLLEKVAPRGLPLARASGLLLTGWGAVMLVIGLT